MFFNTFFTQICSKLWWGLPGSTISSKRRVVFILSQQVTGYSEFERFRNKSIDESGERAVILKLARFFLSMDWSTILSYLHLPSELQQFVFDGVQLSNSSLGQLISFLRQVMYLPLHHAVAAAKFHSHHRRISIPRKWQGAENELEQPDTLLLSSSKRAGSSCLSSSSGFN